MCFLLRIQYSIHPRNQIPIDRMQVRIRGKFPIRFDKSSPHTLCFHKRLESTVPQIHDIFHKFLCKRTQFAFDCSRSEANRLQRTEKVFSF